MPDDRPSIEELELRIKEQELKLKETEVRVKEKELGASKWSNPLVIAIFAAAVGLLGNFLVAFTNNQSSQKIERARAQSTLIIEAIKTNGDTTVACKNLTFFVTLGLLDDPDKTITGACPDTHKGVPTLPSSGPPDKTERGLEFPLKIKVIDEKEKPVAGAAVEISSYPSNVLRCVTDQGGECNFGMTPIGGFMVVVKKPGYAEARILQEWIGYTVIAKITHVEGDRPPS